MYCCEQLFFTEKFLCIRTLPQNISYYCLFLRFSFDFDLRLAFPPLFFLHNITQPFPHNVIRRVSDVDAQAVSAVRVLAVAVVLVVVEDQG